MAHRQKKLVRIMKRTYKFHSDILCTKPYALW